MLAVSLVSHTARLSGVANSRQAPSADGQPNRSSLYRERSPNSGVPVAATVRP